MKTLALLLFALIFSAHFFSIALTPLAYAWNDCECYCGSNSPNGRTGQDGTCVACGDGSAPWYANCHETTDPNYGSYYGQTSFKPGVQIPGYTYDTNKTGSTYNIATYIKAIYNYGVGIVGILAAVGIMVGGFIWLTAGGNASKVGEAQAWIGSSISGLALVMFAYLILNTINPALVNLKISTVKQVTNDATKDTSQPFEGRTTCGTGQHLGFQNQPYQYLNCTAQLEVCTCVNGEGGDECSSTGQPRNGKPPGSNCGVWNNGNLDNSACICCAQCINKSCKQGGCLMGVCSAVCN
jgi:hypothetical protein